MHEFGHHFASLADAYYTSPVPTPWPKAEFEARQRHAGAVGHMIDLYAGPRRPD